MNSLLDMGPLPIAPTVAVVGVTAALLVGMWMQTGRKLFIGIALAAVLLAAGLLVATRMVENERRRVAATLEEIAHLVERGDYDALEDYVYSGSPRIAQRARAELPTYEIERVDIKSRTLKIEIDSLDDPPKAVADFNVVVHLGGDRNEDLFAGRIVPRHVVVTLRKENGKWRVADYRHDDPRNGLRRGR